MEEMKEMEEQNFLEMAALALEDDKAVVEHMHEKHLCDYLEVESQSATNVTIQSHGLSGRKFEDTFENAQWI